MGSLDHPFNPLSSLAHRRGGDVCRPLDRHHRSWTASTQHRCWRAAYAHHGTAFVEIYQNCNVFNDGAWDYAKDRDTKADTTLELEHGKPLIFGKDRNKGVRLNGLDPEVVDLGKGVTEDDLLFHDEKAAEPSLAYLLSRMRYEDGFPEPIGVFRSVDRPRYDELVNDQISVATNDKGEGDLDTLFNAGETWTVE